MHRSERYDDFDAEDGRDDERARVAPGRVTLTSKLGPRRVQAKTSSQLPSHPARRPRASGARELDLDVQLRGDRGGASDGEVHDAAARGVAGFGGALPFLDQIQRSFGPQHDVSAVRAHSDDSAASAARAIGAEAYATGDRIAFAAAPDLHTAAHEAAHVIQQRRGVSLAGGVGASGDAYERHADAVADAVVRGESAAALLDGGPSGASGSPAVQRKGPGDLASGANALLAKSIAIAMPGNAIAAQLLGSVAIDETLAGLVNGWITTLITADVDRWAAAGIDAALSYFITGGAAAIEPVVDGLEKVLAVWAAIPRPLQQVLLFIIGRFLQIVENLIVKLCAKVGAIAKRETNGDGEAVNTHQIAKVFEFVATGTDIVVMLRPILIGIRTFLSGMPASAGWRIFGGWVSRKIVDFGWWTASWFVGWVPRGELPDDKPADAPLPKVKSKDDQLSLSALAPPQPQPSGSAPTNAMMRKVNIGPMAIVPNGFGIVRGTEDKVGGLEVSAGLEFNFLESGKTIPTIEGAARIDWDGKFSWDVALKSPIQLLDKAKLGFLSIEDVKLKKIQANDQFMELGLSAAKIEVGTFLKTGAVDVTWNSRSGLGLNLEDIAVDLPDPLAKVSGSLAMQIDRAGKLGLFELTHLTAGKSFTIARAAYTKDEFAIENARYQLPKALLGTETWIGFGARIGADGKLLALSGEIGVPELYPLGDKDERFRIGGTAKVGYDQGSFTLGLADAHLAVETSKISGYAGISEATFRLAKDGQKTFKIVMPKLELRAGMIQATLLGAQLDSDQRVLGADAGSLRFVSDKKDDVKGDLSDLGMDDAASWIKNLSFLSQLATASITKPRIENKKLKWDSIQLGPDGGSGKKHVNINLFGGLVRGMYDEETSTAKIGGHFAYPTHGAPWIPPLAAEYHFVPGLGVFVELSVPGGFTADVDATLTKKDTGVFTVKGTAALRAHLGVSLKGGIVAGSSYMAAARAYLEASAMLLATPTATLEADVAKDKDGHLAIVRPNPKFMSYKFSGDLIAQISLGVDLAALMMFSKRLVRINLKTWKMGLFNVEGELGENEDGKIVHKRRKPTKETKKEDQDQTMGGAFEKAPKLDREALQPLPVDTAIELLEQKGEKIDDPRFANRLITDIEEASMPAPRKETLRKKVEHLFATPKGKEKQTTEMLAGFAKEAKDFATKRKLGSLGVTSRIMTLDQWQTYSDVRLLDVTEATGSADRGKSVGEIDKAVAHYHSIVIPETGTADAILAALKQRIDALALLKAACESYLEGANGLLATVARKGRKQEMVKTLLDACTAEEAQLQPFLERAQAIAGKKDDKQKKED